MALRDQPYLPLYVMDFLTDERLRECSAESIGVYIMTMCVLHKQKEYGKLTLNKRDKQNFQQQENNVPIFAIKLHYHLPFDVPCIERSLIELLEREIVTIEGDTLYQKRMVKDGQISIKRSEAGKKGASATNGKEFAEANSSAGAEDFAEAKQSANVSANSENEIEYENEVESNNKTSLREKRKRTEELFKKFWQAYPRKSSKKTALTRWLKIEPDEELFETIMKGLEIAKRCDQWKEVRFIPHPATWLNQERWNDEYLIGRKKESVATDEGASTFDPDNPYADWGEEV